MGTIHHDHDYRRYWMPWNEYTCHLGRCLHPSPSNGLGYSHSTLSCRRQPHDRLRPTRHRPLHTKYGRQTHVRRPRPPHEFRHRQILPTRSTFHLNGNSHRPRRRGIMENKPIRSTEERELSLHPHHLLNLLNLIGLLPGELRFVPSEVPIGGRFSINRTTQIQTRNNISRR